MLLYFNTYYTVWFIGCPRYSDGCYNYSYNNQTMYVIHL